MRKITLKIFMIMCLLGTYVGVSQTLNQNASWPNVNWTVTGTYNADPTAFEADPTVSANFAFDDDDAGGSSDDDIAAESPVIDLTAASGAGETWITVSGDYTYNFLADILTLQYWDADAAAWTAWYTFTENDNSTTNDFCTGTRTTFTSTVLDIGGFTATQLAGFRYRIEFLDDGGAGGAAWEWGFCFDAPTITSAAPPTCLDPSMLATANITDTTADLSWMENGTATLWNIEIVDVTAGGTPTGTATVTGVTNPYTATGLTQDNDYEFYVLADCGPGGLSNWVGPFAFRTLETCPTPSGLTATNIMETTADLGWMENGTATLWDVEVVTSGSAATGTPTASGVANPYMATGLTADTEYDFYVRADCGVGGTSNWAGPFTFRTACAAFAAPYTEDFETFAVSPSPFASGNCWTGSNTSGSYFWESAAGTDTSSGGTGPSPTITTGNYFFTEASGSSAGDITELVSPLVDLTALTAPALTFNYHMYGAQIGTLDVLVNGTTNVWTLSGEQQAMDTTPWELAVIDLAAYAGQTISITFRATGAGTFEGDIAIDNVSFTELPACPDPTMLSTSNVTDDSADLGWTENGSATVWDIEIVDITAGGMATGTPTAAGVMTNPYTASGLTQNNDYVFYVRSDCGGGTLSGWAGPFAFTTLETCPAPSALNATNIMETTADLGWTENGAATLWNIEIVDITAGGTATGTPTASGVVNPYMATGLVGDNSYAFYVQADCGVDGVSAWAGPFNFSTPYVAVPPDCTNGTFLDSGGNSGNYSNSENITYTICPDMAGEVVNVEFTFFSIENNGATACWDELTIHDGADATAPTIDSPNGPGWCWDRNDATPAGSGDLQGMTITSSDASGCLTFVFTSDTSAVRPGWAANVTCTPLSVESAEVRGFVHYVNTNTNSFVVNAQSTIESIEVYNLVGQTITKVSPNAAEGQAYLGSARNGVYFARVTLQNGRTSVVKFLK